MILTDSEILSQMGRGFIQIIPFNREQLGSNSYDVTLGDNLLVYTREYEISNNGAFNYMNPQEQMVQVPLDVKKNNPHILLAIPPEGFVLQPGELYLGNTIEYTESGPFLPQLEGKSSLARLGIVVHLTAGFGDIGFKGHWTLEITVVRPVRIYAGMTIAQIYYMEALGNVDRPYNKKVSAKYHGQKAVPVPSYMWKNFSTESNKPSL